MTLELQPITFKEACDFIVAYHSHHLPPQGWKFGIGVNDGEKVVGVIVIGRPVSRFMDNGWTLEVTRCCTDKTHNVASMLYSAAWRAVRSMGYKRLITYTLKEEPGTSLIAAGWKALYETKGGEWNCNSRPRVQGKYPIGQKTLWEVKNFEKENGKK